MMTAESTTQTPIHPDHSSRSRTVWVGQQRLRVTVENPGRGRPLLLINGIGATGDLFDPFREFLHDRETIAFDAPGVGRSPAPFLPTTMRQLSDIVAGLARQLGHAQVDVLGLSWGGALAQELARRHPQLVNRLVLAATMPGWAGVPGQLGALSILMSPARYFSPDYLRRVAPTLYGGAIVDHPHLLDEHARQRKTHRPSFLGYIYQLMAIQGWTSVHWLRWLGHPTLILAGDDDPIIPVANGRILASRIPNGRLDVVEGGGHLFLLVRGEEMANRVRYFLDTEDPEDSEAG